PAQDYIVDVDEPKCLQCLPNDAQFRNYREVYDARLKPVGWSVVGFDDSDWQHAVLAHENGLPSRLKLSARGKPLLQEWEEWPVGVAESANVFDSNALLRKRGGFASFEPNCGSYVVVDFGREVVGFPTLRFRDSGLAVVDVISGMALSDCSNPCALDAQAVADRVIVDGGRREWSTFGRRAFRYLRVMCRAIERPVCIESVSVRRIGYPLEQVSTFECSDAKLNELWQSSVHRLRLCMQDTFEECPAADVHPSPPSLARIQALANYHCFYDRYLPREALRRFARISKSDPAWIAMLHDYYLYTGDCMLVRDLYESVVSTVDSWTQIAPSHYAALRDASKLAQAVGDAARAMGWHDRADDVKRRLGRQVSEELHPMADITASDLIDARNGDPSVVYVLSAIVLGVRPSMPESDVVIVQPKPDKLLWAKGRLAIRETYAEVAWNVSENCFVVEINAPGGFILGLPVLGFKNPVVDEIDLTPETPERRARRTYGWGTAIWRDGEERDPYLDWLKAQDEEPPAHYKPQPRCVMESGYLWIRKGASHKVRYEVTESK
ncbi:MAG: hypothetical protein QHI38_11620, partial [Armatimonadota bacterium]|nr:hypothetical protein [Armatimonadota bacterium]